MNIPKKPSDVIFTDEQWLAIHAEGRDILVSAAAGSGKTHVLITRLVEKIVRPVDPIDVDELLVVTFTNAAAAEMRQRLGEALEEKIQATDNRHMQERLRRQVVLLNKAHISTLHAFCSTVVRQYAYLLDIDPGFRLGSEQEVALMQEEALEEVLERAYSGHAYEAMYDAADRFSYGRDDSGIEKLIYSLYNYARVEPNPGAWLRRIPKQYDVKAIQSLTEWPLADEWMTFVHEQYDNVQQAYETYIHYLQAMEAEGRVVPEKLYAIAQGEDYTVFEQIRLAMKENHWDAIARLMPQSIKWVSPRKKKGEDDEVNKQGMALRNAFKETVHAFVGLFARSEQQLLRDIEEMYEPIRTLIRLVEDFHKTYERMKEEEAVLDFSDLEHYALQILSTDGHGEHPSEIAELYQQQFAEVLVDEYQDTNILQERIIQLVKKGDEQNGNLFMVGDVKQSIYRFRLAEPNLFLNKMKRFSTDLNDSTTGLVIHLNKNFRSRKEVLNSTNFVFYQLMDEHVGEITYDEDAALAYGATYYEEADERAGKTPTCETIFARIEAAEEKNEESKAVFEARWMARRIRQWLKEGKEVRGDDGVMRPMTYRDIAILQRSMSAAPDIAAVFREEGIPLYVELSKGFFDAVEVKILLSVLAMIDNPYQDIPLVATLRAPFYRFTNEDLARIRLVDRKVPFFEALQQYAKETNDPLATRARHFLQTLSRWRSLARHGSLSHLIWTIFLETKYYEMLGAMPNGKQRQANLRVLHDRAIAYEQTANRGLFRFLRFIERMKDVDEDIGEARYVTEEDNVVQMMTVHGSKGLEYPIVFMSSLHKDFNFRDTTGAYMFDQQYGLVTKSIDPVKNTERDNMLTMMTKVKKEREMRAEEMRILYVAMTRAKEQLVLLGYTTDKEEEEAFAVARTLEGEQGLPTSDRSRAKSYFDWLLPAVSRHTDWPEGPFLDTPFFAQTTKMWQLERVNEEQLPSLEVKNEQQVVETAKETEWTEKVEARFNYRYPYKDATMQPSKESVSEVNRALTEEVAHPVQPSPLVVTEEQVYPFERPSFVQDQALTAAERGTAIHAVMEHIPWTIEPKIEVITTFIDTLVERQLLTEEEQAVIDVEDIQRFLQAPITKQLRNAQKVYRELPFTYAYRATKESEPQLMQGIIDCFFVDETGKGYVLDFKTDRLKKYGTKENKIQELHRRYSVQLNLYRQAVERATQLKVGRSLIYSFDCHEVIEVPILPIGYVEE